MIFRTDLAKEALENTSERKGVISKKINSFGIEGDFVQLTEDCNELGKKKGKYISFETDSVIMRNVENYENISKVYSSLTSCVCVCVLFSGSEASSARVDRI